jgi:hypothetical protein
MDPAVWTVMVMVWVISAIICCTVADSKGHSSLGWLMLGFLFGPLAVLIIVAIPGQTPTPTREPEVSVSPKPVVMDGTIADELIKLADLKDRGALSEEEFAAQKARLLT